MNLINLFFKVNNWQHFVLFFITDKRVLIVPNDDHFYGYLKGEVFRLDLLTKKILKNLRRNLERKNGE